MFTHVHYAKRSNYVFVGRVAFIERYATRNFIINIHITVTRRRSVCSLHSLNSFDVASVHRRFRAERRPDLEPRSHPSRRIVAADVRLRPRGGPVVLDKMVLRRPRVLQVRAEGVAAHEGFPTVW